MKKLILISTFIFHSFNSNSQNGWIQFDNDSILFGYLKFPTERIDHKSGIEIWKTKNDRNPLFYEYGQLKSYSYQKDTIIIFKNFIPFPYFYKISFPLVQAKIILKGKLNLLETLNVQALADYSLLYSLYSRDLMYIIFEESTGYSKCIQSGNYFISSIKELIENDSELTNKTYSKELKFKNLKKIVESYNSRN